MKNSPWLKLLVILIVISMTVSIVACDGQNEANTDAGTESEPVSTQQESEIESIEKPESESESETDPVFESTTETDPVTESTTETNPVTEPTTETNPVTESTTETNPVTESTTETNPVTESTTETNPVTEPTTETNPVTEPTTETNPVTEPTTETNPVTEPTTETNPVTESTTETNPVTEPTTETNPVTESTTETNPVTEPTTETNPVTESTTETNPVTESTTETNPVTETTTEAEPCDHTFTKQTSQNDWVITCEDCDYRYEYGLDLSSAQKTWTSTEIYAYGEIQIGTDSQRMDFTKDNFEIDSPEFGRISNLRRADSQFALGLTGIKGERYLVIKLRVGKNGLGQGYMQFYVATDNIAYGASGGGFPINVKEDGAWHTVVVDLAERVGDATNRVGENDELNKVYIRPFGNAQSAAIGNTSAYIDIAYIAACDSLSDVAGLVSEDTCEWSISGNESEIKNTSDLKDAEEETTEAPTEAPTESETEPEVPTEAPDYTPVEPSAICEKCNVTVSQEGNQYTWKCTVCNTVFDEKTLSDTVNYYTAVGQFCTSAWASSTDGKIYADGDVLYQRFSITNHGGTIPLVTSGNVKEPYLVETKGGNGNYFVFKIKTTNAIALSWRITAKTEGEAATDPAGNYPGMRTVMPNGEWTVYVVDIAALIKASGIATYSTAGNTEITQFAAGFMYGKDGLGAASDTYLDIAYFAVCDTWDEVASVVGDEKVTYTDWKNTSSDKRLASDGELPVDTKGEDAAKVIFTKTGENIHIFLRSPNAEKYTRYDFLHSVDSSINYDSWKLVSIEICDSDLNKLYNTATDDKTECEGALQERLSDGTLAADFIGGFHGDEKLKKIAVLIDGAEIDMSKDYDLTACQSVQAIVESDLFRCNSTEKVFDRVRTNTWTEDGLEIKNEYTATVDITINRPATAMLAIAIDNDGYEGLITEHWDNVHNEWIEIGEFTASEGRYSASGMTEARMRGLLDVYVSIYDNKINGVDNTPVGHFSYNYFSSTNKRIKIYLDAFSNVSLKTGDVFECSTFQSVFATQ